MPAELHLAEDAFALHLSLQRLEGLIDIVVTDENLHVVLLFNPTVDRPNSQGAWATAARKCATAACVYIYISHAACHSLAYIPMNSPYLKPAQWDAEVDKMINAMGAPIDPADAQAIKNYLANNYGG